MKQTTLLLLTAAGAFVWYRLGGGRHAGGRSASTAEPRLDAKPERAGPAPVDLSVRAGDTATRPQPSNAGPAGSGLAGASPERNNVVAPPRREEQQGEAITPGLPDFARGA